MHYVDRLIDDNDLLSEFGNTIRLLQSVGHEIVLIGDIPKYEIHAQDCVYARNALAAKEQCSMNRKEAVQQELIYRNTLTELSKSFSVKYYSISEYLCGDEICSMVLGDVILYRDNNHLNIPGSVFIGKHLADLLE